MNRRTGFWEVLTSYGAPFWWHCSWSGIPGVGQALWGQVRWQFDGKGCGNSWLVSFGCIPWRAKRNNSDGLGSRYWSHLTLLDCYCGAKKLRPYFWFRVFGIGLLVYRIPEEHRATHQELEWSTRVGNYDVGVLLNRPMRYKKYVP